MTNSQNESIRAALLGYEIGALTLVTILAERVGLTVVDKILYHRPFDPEEVIPAIVEKKPSIFILGVLANFEEGEELARQIRLYAPNIPILGTAHQKSNEKPQYMNDCLYMLTSFQAMEEAVIRLVGDSAPS
jgi:hypothetical protein